MKIKNARQCIRGGRFRFPRPSGRCRIDLKLRGDSDVFKARLQLFRIALVDRFKIGVAVDLVQEQDQRLDGVLSSGDAVEIACQDYAPPMGIRRSVELDSGCLRAPIDPPSELTRLASVDFAK
ncbi:hypothetical protein QM467_08680 [Rhodoblastus sp. 17X3]|uniref:hypothetical protein n=1 Tax=Rhodoblastus sp. 17X3 TaxID=3047026 RepID=UPI0024B6AA6D|nr:hypothetical protein [Rhodoblastus sp. 17X3]MDI9848126.1 hypothetical protein [Rhodoblastus sp. 17X3]